MPQTINTNLASLNAQRNMNSSQGALSTAMQRLSSGMRVNSAKDDAAGLAIAERMNSQVRGMNVAVRNANDGISYSQTAEGALGKIADSLQRMRELALQAKNATNSDSDRTSLNKEFENLQAEITRVIGGTTFNGKSVLADSTTLTLQIGANTTTNDVLEVSGLDLTATNDTDIDNVTTSTADIATSDAATIDTIIGNIDTVINKVNDKRADMGATQNRLDTIISNLQVSLENQTAARGRIMDADFASETANLSRAQILQQAGNAMLSQANQLPQQVLKLLQG